MPVPGALGVNTINKNQVLSRFPAHKERLKDKEVACRDCHPQVKYTPQNTSELVAPLFIHKIHLEEGANCSDCHPAKDGSGLKPVKSNCEQCHSDQHNEADDVGKNCTNCTNCHEPKPGEKHHPANWEDTHGKDRSTRQALCHDCHDESQEAPRCTDCHDRSSIAPKSHGIKNFREFTHPFEIRRPMKGVAYCATCHSLETFCANCHANYKRMPESHSKLSFISGHGRQAMQDPEYCESCHGKGQTCYECHREGIKKR